MEAGAVLCHRGRVLVPAGMNESWRIFCRPVTYLIEYYELQALTERSERQGVAPKDLTELKASVMGYKVDKWPESCLGCRKLVNGHWRSVTPKVLTEARGERNGLQIVSEP
jgi:hypothetical protein